MDQKARAQREAELLRKRYPSHGRQPRQVEVKPDDPPEVRRNKLRYPSHYVDKR